MTRKRIFRKIEQTDSPRGFLGMLGKENAEHGLLAMRNPQQERVPFSFQKRMRKKRTKEIDNTTYLQRAIKEKNGITLQLMTQQGIREILVLPVDIVRFLKNPRITEKAIQRQSLVGKTYHEARRRGQAKKDSNAITEFVEIFVPQVKVASKFAVDIVTSPFKSIPKFLGVSEETGKEGIKIIGALSGKQKKHKKASVRRITRTAWQAIRGRVN